MSDTGIPTGYWWVVLFIAVTMNSTGCSSDYCQGRKQSRVHAQVVGFVQALMGLTFPDEELPIAE